MHTIVADEQILETLFEGLDADILHVPGGHVGMIVQAEEYLKRIEPFLAGCFSAIES